MNYNIPHGEFIRVANIKGEIAHIINQACKKSVAEVSKLSGAWLVKEESIYHVLFLVRFLKQKEREQLYDTLHYFFETDEQGIIKITENPVIDTIEMQIDVSIKCEY